MIPTDVVKNEDNIFEPCHNTAFNLGPGESLSCLQHRYWFEASFLHFNTIGVVTRGLFTVVKSDEFGNGLLLQGDSPWSAVLNNSIKPL